VTRPLARLLIVSDSPSLPASYANIARNFAHEVSERGVSVAFGSLQHTGLPLRYEYRGRTYPHYGCAPPHRIVDAVTDFDPDLVIHIRDPLVHVVRFFPQGNYSVRKQVTNGAGVWGWLPAQHEVSPWDYIEAIHAEYDVVMPFTASGGELLGNAGLVRDRIEPLQLGVSDAYADPDGPAATGYGDPKVPLVMSVGLGHQDRKAFPVLMRAYREIAGRTNLEFYLHTLRIGAFDLEEHARMMGVEGKWMFPHLYDPGIGYPEDDLAKRYRRARAYVSVGTGEGFDMPLSEACALGRMVIYPDEPVRGEVVADYEGPKAAVRSFPFPRNMNWERMIDCDDLARALLLVDGAAPDPAAGRRYYERHSWARVAEKFLEIAKRRGVA